MSEGRKTEIILLEWDKRKLDLLVQPKLLSGELLDLVASHLSLKEKEYFGVAFVDDTGHYYWLHLDKRVLEHEFPTKTGLLRLFFAVRFYTESINQLRDNATIEAFYMNARQMVFKGQIQCDCETAFELAAHVLQTTHGDFVSESRAKIDLKKLPVLPTTTLQEHPSLSYCEERIIFHYQKLAGTSRGLAVVNYMGIVESLETYGIHFYAVKDKKELPWWLGLSFKGLAIYDKTDKKIPRKSFSWRQLENLYYRDKKFSVEVHDPKRVVHALSSFNLYEDAIREPLDDFDDLSDAISDPTTQVSVSRRTFGPGNVTVHAWFASTPQLTKSIWSMAVAQHQFYLDRKHSKSPLPAVRSMSEIAAELSHSTASLSSSQASDLSRSESSHSIPSLSTSKFDVNLDQTEQTRAAQRNMYCALKQRKEALEEAMRKKIEELKSLCLKEGELTGKLPVEYPIQPGENPPIIRRRIGTSFSLNARAVSQNNSDTSNELSQLELEYDLQSKITHAAHILAKDKSVGKTARKQRSQSYHKSMAKLKEMEKKLNELRRLAGRGALKSPSMPLHNRSNISNISADTRSECGIVPTDSTGDLHSLASSTSDIISTRESPALIRHSPSMGRTDWDNMSTQMSVHIEDMSANDGHHGFQGSEVLPSAGPGQGSSSQTGYVTSPVYSTQTQYRNQRFPTFSSKSRSEYDTGYHGHTPYARSYSGPSSPVSTGSNSNLYNVNTRRTSQYDSSDELRTPTNVENCGDNNVFDVRVSASEDKFSTPAVSHRSLDRTQQQQCNTSLSPGLSSAIYMYGSLDRRDRGRGDSAVDRGYPSEFCPTDLPQNSSDVDVTRGYPRDYCPTESPSPRPDLYRDTTTTSSTGLHNSHFEYPTPRSSSSDSGSVYRDTGQPVSVSVTVSRSNSENWKSPQYPTPDTPGHGRRLHIHVTEAGEGQCRSDLNSTHRGDSDGALHKQYSPRYYEGHYAYPEAHTASYDQGRTLKIHTESLQPSPAPQQSRIVTMNKMKPHTEVSKPYEMSDFYKYSERLRRQRKIEQYKQILIGSENISLRSTSSQHSSDSDHSYLGGSTAVHGHSSVSSSNSDLHVPPSSPYSSGPSSPYPQSSSFPYSHSSSPSPSYANPIPMQAGVPHHQTGHVKGPSAHVQYTYHTPVGSPSSSTVPYKASPHVQSGHQLAVPVQHSLRQTHYQPPKAMSCKPVLVHQQDSSRGKIPGSPAYPRSSESQNAAGPFKSPDGSFNYDASESLAEAFSEEMLKWYEDQDGNKKSATLV